MDKRYQVFISSTYVDLQDERKAVSEIILQDGHFPVGMEAFGAAAANTLDYIKKLIDLSDYYILIIGGKYGSIDTETKKSYTQLEFEYARSKNVPTFVFINEDYRRLDISKRETEPNRIEKLDNFIKISTHGTLRETWSDRDDLARKVLQTFSREKSRIPGIGWVRANTVAKGEVLEELYSLRKKNDALVKQLKSVKNRPFDYNYEVELKIYIGVSWDAFNPHIYALSNCFAIIRISIGAILLKVRNKFGTSQFDVINSTNWDGFSFKTTIENLISTETELINRISQFIEMQPISMVLKLDEDIVEWLFAFLSEKGYFRTKDGKHKLSDFGFKTTNQVLLEERLPQIEIVRGFEKDEVLSDEKIFPKPKTTEDDQIPF